MDVTVVDETAPVISCADGTQDACGCDGTVSDDVGHVAHDHVGHTHVASSAVSVRAAGGAAPTLTYMVVGTDPSGDGDPVALAMWPARRRRPETP